MHKELPYGRVVAADQFSLAISGAGAPPAVTTAGEETTVTGSVEHVAATPGAAYVLSETGAAGANLDSYVTTYSCTNTLDGGQAPAGSDVSFSMTPVAGDDLTCTFRNAAKPRLTLVKTVTNDNGGTQLPTARTLTASGPTAISGTTGSPAVTDVIVDPGMYVLSESVTPLHYIASPYSCVKNGAAAESGDSIVLDVGDVATCTIHNDDSNVADLSITKSNDLSAVMSGQELTYELVVRNQGPASGDGAVIHGPSPANMVCTAVACGSASGGAVCPAVSVAQLQSAAGVIVETLPANSALTLTLTCRID